MGNVSIRNFEVKSAHRARGLALAVVLLAHDVLKQLAARAQAHGDRHPAGGLVLHHVQ